MKSLLSAFLCLFIFSFQAGGQDLENRAENLTIQEMQSVIEFLSHDLLEGRAPGTRGGELAEQYVLSLFKLMGLKPGAGSDYFQPFTMKGFATQSLSISSGSRSLKFPEEIVGDWIEEKDTFVFEGDAVFMGFGIRTPIWNWDDYKNVDLKDKILIVRVNDPGQYLPEIFEGGTLTYFGRWRYKIEEAVKSGAKGILLIHTDESAGYGWHVVKNSWAKENLYLESELAGNLKLRGWIREDSFQKILSEKGIKLEDLYRKSLRRRFRPVFLPVRIKINGESKFRDTHARNVVASLPGKSEKEIVLSAHIDHLGMSQQEAGDSIFNGAIDNGSAVAAMMLCAKLLSESQIHLPCSVTFLACQAEEEGLLGSEYFVTHSDRKRIIANINFESSPVWGKAKSLFAVGAKYSTLEEMIREIASEMGLEYGEFSLGGQGFFYRSDQFPFARLGIPATWISAGETFVSGKNHVKEFFVGGDYHTVRDEFHPEWKLESLKQTIVIALKLMQRIANAPQPPKWKGKLTFPTEK